MSLGIKSLWRTRSQRIVTLRNSIPRFSGPSYRLQTRDRHVFNDRHEEQRGDRSCSSSMVALVPENGQAKLATVSEGRAQIVRSKHARNEVFRKAFRQPFDVIRNAVQEKEESSPYVPDIRDYPSEKATKSSRLQATRIARTQVGIDAVWKKFGQRIPAWSETFELLKRMTLRRMEKSSLAAVKIVFPSTWDMSVCSGKLEFLDASTGLATKLQVSTESQSPLAVILRGEGAALVKAADELVRTCADIEVFDLGEVTALEYMEKRLWPSIADAPNDGSSVPTDSRDKIWLHEEVETYWIDKPYEQVSKPSHWTKESFEVYVTSLMCGRLRPHLAMKYYRQPRDNGKLIDTDGIRIRLVLRAFEDPSARVFITPYLLKMAIAFMCQKGGHRSSANRLLQRAERWGSLIDTEVFNIMLNGYVLKRDAGFFHQLLEKMQELSLLPNCRTWLHFLNLVQRDNKRLQIIAVMRRLGLVEDVNTRRGIAQIMASHDAHAAFGAGKSLESFMTDQDSRYGIDWMTTEALNNIIKEFFHFNDRRSASLTPFRAFIEHLHSDSRRKLKLTTVHVILQSCIQNEDWSTTQWLLSFLHKQGTELSPITYSLLISLSIATKARASLGAILFHAILERKLHPPVRRSIHKVLFKNILYDSPVHIFSNDIGALLRHNPLSQKSRAVAGVERAILQVCDGYKPTESLASALDFTCRTMDNPRARHTKTGNDAAVVPCYVVKLQDTTGRRPHLNVHLNAAFVPEDMVRDVNGTPWHEETPPPVRRTHSPSHTEDSPVRLSCREIHSA